MTSEPGLRVAVIGTRGHARRVAIPTILASERAEIVGVLGTDVERTREVAANLGVRGYHSLEELAEGSGVDAVWITAPNHRHVEFASRLLAAGKSTLVEKPMAIDESSGHDLARLAGSSQAVLRVAYQHRFRAAHRELRNILISGALGDLGYLHIHRYWRFPYFAGQETHELSDWRGSPDSSGGWSINDIGSHLIDLVIWLAGARPVSLLGAVFTRQYPGVVNDSSNFLTMRLGSRCIVHLDSSNVLESPGSLVEVYGDRGWVRLIGSFHERARLLSSFAPDQTMLTTDQAAYLQMFDDFVGACRGEAGDGAGALEALESVRIIQKARREGHYLEDAQRISALDRRETQRG